MFMVELQMLCGSSDHCGICFDSSSTEKNPLIVCSKCDVAVHCECYLVEVPEDDWTCKLCASDDESGQCPLCPFNGGDTFLNVFPVALRLDTVLCRGVAANLRRRVGSRSLRALGFAHVFQRWRGWHRADSWSAGCEARLSKSVWELLLVW